MKRFLLGLFTIFYFGISTGATLHIHYCMGKMVGIDLVNKDSSHCHRCGMKKVNGKKGCCHDEQRVAKITNDQSVTEATCQMMQLSSVAIMPDHMELAAVLIFSRAANVIPTNSFLRSPQVAVYIRNCVFLI